MENITPDQKQQKLHLGYNFFGLFGLNKEISNLFNVGDVSIV